MKIAVYALCKNEVNNVDAWYQSCKDADLIVVTDTGSTDGSIDKLKDIVELHHARIMPWRFDDAFNHAMNNLPADVDVCIRLDFDERLQDGWRQVIEEEWKEGTTRLRYPYVWNWTADGKPDRQWMGDRIHARSNYRWTGATHEGLVCRGQETAVWTQRLRIHQYPEAKARPNDLPLLEEAVKDTPNDARLWGYLGREYFFKNQVDDARRTYKHFLTLNSATQERVQAYLYLAKCEPESAEFWLKEGMREGPEYREPIVDLAMHYYGRKEWKKCHDACLKALQITSRPESYITRSEYWRDVPHDLLSVSAWNLGYKDIALQHAEIAVRENPTDERLQNNLRLISEGIETSNQEAA